MKSKLQTAVLVLGFISMTSFLGMVLALSDIYHDYLSPKQLHAFSLDQSNLPDWTLCQLEWSMVTFSLFIIFSFFLVSIIYQVKKHSLITTTKSLLKNEENNYQSSNNPAASDRVNVAAERKR